MLKNRSHFLFGKPLANMLEKILNTMRICEGCGKEHYIPDNKKHCLPCVMKLKHRKDVDVFIEKTKELTKNGKIITLKESTGPNCPECSFEQVNGHSQSCSKYEIKITDF